MHSTFSTRRREENTEHTVTGEKEQLDFGSSNKRYRNVKDKTDERSRDRLIDHTERIGAYYVSIGNAYGRWPLPDRHDKDVPADFHAFWKDEGNAKTIREAQGMRDEMVHTVQNFTDHPTEDPFLSRADTCTFSEDNVRIHG